MPCNHLILCRPLLFLPSIFPNIRVFSSESALHIRWPKYWTSASTSVLPMNNQGVPFKIDWFVLFAIQGTLRSFLQHPWTPLNHMNSMNRLQKHFQFQRIKITIHKKQCQAILCPSVVIGKFPASDLQKATQGAKNRERNHGFCFWTLILHSLPGQWNSGLPHPSPCTNYLTHFWLSELIAKWDLDPEPYRRQGLFQHRLHRTQSFSCIICASLGPEF